MTVPLTLPSVGGSANTWGTTLNNAFTQVNSHDLFKRKTAPQAVTFNITKVDDNHLADSVVASGVYMVLWSLRIDGGAGDFRYAWAGPTGATMTWESQSLAATDTTNVAPPITDVPLIGTDAVHGTLGAGTTIRVRGSGLLVIGANAGTFKMQWAQGTSNATATTVLAESWMRARRVA